MAQLHKEQKLPACHLPLLQLHLGVLVTNCDPIAEGFKTQRLCND